MRETMEDTDISRMLLNKALNIDNNFLTAKIMIARTWLGWKSNEKSNLDTALNLYNETLKQAEKNDDKQMIASSLHGIGGFYYYKAFDRGEQSHSLDKGLDYAIRAFEIFKEINDKAGMGRSLNGISSFYLKKNMPNKALEYAKSSLRINKQMENRLGISHNLNTIGGIFRSQGDLDKAIITLSESIKIKEENNWKSGLKHSLIAMGHIHYDIGKYNDALKYYNNALKIFKNIGDKEEGMAFIYKCISSIYLIEHEYLKAEEFIEKSITIQNQKKMKGLQLSSTVLLYLIKNKLSKFFDINTIYEVIKRNKKYIIDEEVSFQLFRLLKDLKYVEAAYNQVQEKASAMEEKLGKKFLSYPIPKAIVEAWEKVNR